MARSVEWKLGVFAALLAAMLPAILGFPLFIDDGGGDSGGGGGGAGCSPPAGHIPITAASELQSISAAPASNYYLCNDIDLTGISWTPISNFSGIFEGANFTISNLTINSPSSNNLGLFASLAGSAQIQNLTLQNFNISGGNYIGALAGQINAAAALVTNVYVSGLISCGHSCGMLAGYAANTEFSNNSAAADLSGSNKVGGLVGHGVQSSFLNCAATTSGGSVVGQNSVGGLLGLGSGTSIYRSTFSGSISCPAAGPSGPGSETNVGGIIGALSSGGSSNASIDQVSATGAINCADAAQVGGIAGSLSGSNSGSKSLVSNAITDITISGGGFLGGLIGYLGAYSSVSTSYAKRSAASCSVETSGEAIGGIYDNTALVTAAYTNSDSGNSGNFCREFCTGENICKTTSEMLEIATFSGWDISTSSQNSNSSVWKIAPGTFPYLSFLHPTSPPPTEPPTPTPTVSPSPTASPTASPTLSPTPSQSPTESPTLSPTPTDNPTESPTESPTLSPSPSESPTESPTLSPSPTKTPTAAPTKSPSPTLSPSPEPTADTDDVTPPELVFFRVRVMSPTMLRVGWRTSEPTFSYLTVQTAGLPAHIRVRSAAATSGETVRVRINNPGRYGISLEVKDIAGNSTTALKKATVRP